MKRRWRKLRKMLLMLCVLVVAVVYLSPFYIAFVYSFKTKQEITFTKLALPTQLRFDNYRAVLQDDEFFTALKNSVITTIPTVLLLLIVCPMAAYVLARNKKKGYNMVYTFFLVGLLVPYQAVLLPIYANLRSMGLLNTYLGNILVKVAFQISITILICTGFVNDISTEMEEAAFVDGLGHSGAFWRIIYPLMSPVLISALIIDALFAWNDFQLSTVTLMREQVQTLPQMMYRYFGVRSIAINEAFASFTLSMLPLVVLYLSMQKYITSGVMAGAVKG